MGFKLFGVGFLAALLLLLPTLANTNSGNEPGATWTLRVLGFNDLKRVAYGNGLFVAVGGSPSRGSPLNIGIYYDFPVVYTSPDGVEWTEQFLPTSIWLPKSYWLEGVTYGNGLFVAVGWIGAIFTSPDGVNWTSRFSPTFSPLYSVTYGNGRFVAVGYNGTILTSPDGETWTKRTSPTSNFLNGVTYGNGRFVAVGWRGTVLTSP